MITIESIKDLVYGQQRPEGENLLRKAKATAAAIPLIAQSLVDKVGHKIQIRPINGPGGSTDGTTIRIGATPLPRHAHDIDNYTLFLAMKLGLVYHEVGHVNDTIIDRFPAHDRLLAHILNIIEDVRMENATIVRYRNARTWLDALSMSFVMLGLNGPVQADAPPTHIFTGYLLYRLRAEFRNEPYYTELARQAGEVMEQTFSKGVLTRLEALLPQMDTLVDTDDALTMAIRIRSFLVEEEKQASQAAAASPPSQQSSQQGSSGAGDDSGDTSGESDTDGEGDSEGSTNDADQDAGASGPGDDDSNSEADDDAGAASDPQDDTRDQDDSSTGPSDDSDSSCQSSGDGNTSPIDREKLEQIAQALQEVLQGNDLDTAVGDRDDAAKRYLEEALEEFLADNADLVQVDMDAILNAGKDLSADVHLLPTPHDFTEAMGVISPLRNQLRRKLQAQSIVKTARSDRGTRLDMGNVHRVAFNDPRIFRKSTDGTAVDTSVLFLADVSGSMSGPRLELGSKAIYASCCALDALPGTEVAVAAFPEHQLVLPFGAKPKREERRFSLAAVGSTPMHEGFVMAHRMLMSRRNPRKILFVLTDGEPDCMASASATLDMLTDSGIEVFGLGIQTDYVRHLFDQWVVVNDLVSLPSAVMTVLSHKLTALSA